MIAAMKSARSAKARLPIRRMQVIEKYGKMHFNPGIAMKHVLRQ
jgi:hypothetical protein